MLELSQHLKILSQVNALGFNNSVELDVRALQSDIRGLDCTQKELIWMPETY